MNRKAKKAVTLLEVLLALILISSVGYTVLDSFYSVINLENAQNAKNQLISAIKMARYYARSKGVITQINLPSNSNTYTITAGTSTLTNTSNFDASSGVLPNNTIISSVIPNNCSNLYFSYDGSLIADTSGDAFTSTSSCTISVVALNAGVGLNSNIQGKSVDNSSKQSFVINVNSGSINYD